MSSCKEYVLDDLMAITAIPVAAFAPGTATWQVTPTIADDDLSPAIESSGALADAIVIGQKPATDDGMLIPIRKMTGKARDDESDSVSGRLHTVKVTCDVDDRDLTSDDNGLTVHDYLLLLERTPSHLLLTFRNGLRAFVQATADTYVCNAERDGSKVSVTLRVQNIMGAQLIV